MLLKTKHIAYSLFDVIVNASGQNSNLDFYTTPYGHNYFE